MGRAPCCSRVGLTRGPWTAREDLLLSNYIEANGEGQWRDLPMKAGLLRCGKSCRLRWVNYLRPNIKRGNITPDEEELILRMHNLLGNRWSLIAGRLPGRTDNEIKSHWNTHLCKKLKRKKTHRPVSIAKEEESADLVSIAKEEELSTREMKDVESDSMNVSDAHFHLPKASKYIAFPPPSSNLSLTSTDIGMNKAMDMQISINNKEEQGLFSWPCNDEDEGSLSQFSDSFTSQPPQEAEDDAKCIVGNWNNMVPLSYRQVYEEFMELLIKDSNPNNSIISDIRINDGEQDIYILSDPFLSVWDFLQEDEDEELLNQERENAPNSLSLHQ